MIRAMDLPETHPQRVRWLERELVGTELPRLVTQLVAIHGNELQSQDDTVGALLRDSRLYDQGLSWIDPNQMEALLRQPKQLVRLQQAVLMDGTDYWSKVSPPDDQLPAGRCAAGLSLFADQVGEEIGSASAPSDRTTDSAMSTQGVSLVEAATELPSSQRSGDVGVAPVERSSRWTSTAAWSLLASAATAAALLLTVNQWHPGDDGSKSGAAGLEVAETRPTGAEVQIVQLEPQDSETKVAANQTDSRSLDTSPAEVIAADLADAEGDARPKELLAETTHANGGPQAKTHGASENELEESGVAVAAVKSNGWGFDKFVSQVASDEATLQPPLDRKAYLMQLAGAADAWSNKRPESIPDLVKRLGQFRMGCSAILIAEHGPLAESDRVWLRKRCRSWASALDRHLAAAESTSDPVAVRGQVDATVAKIAESLRGRADTTPS